MKALFKKTSVSDLYPECYVIKTNRFNEVAKDTLDEWIYFLKTAEINDEFTAKGLKAASQKLDILKLDPADKQNMLKVFVKSPNFMVKYRLPTLISSRVSQEKKRPSLLFGQPTSRAESSWLKCR